MLQVRYGNVTNMLLDGGFGCGRAAVGEPAAFPEAQLWDQANPGLVRLGNLARSPFSERCPQKGSGRV